MCAKDERQNADHTKHQVTPVMLLLPLGFSYVSWHRSSSVTHVPVTLLHDGDLLDDLLQIRLHRNLFDGYDLPSFFIMSLKYAAVRPAGTQREA